MMKAKNSMLSWVKMSNFPFFKIEISMTEIQRLIIRSKKRAAKGTIFEETIRGEIEHFHQYPVGWFGYYLQRKK